MANHDDKWRGHQFQFLNTQNFLVTYLAKRLVKKVNSLVLVIFLTFKETKGTTSALI